MKDNTLYMEAAFERERLKIGVYTPADVIWRYEESETRIDQINERCKGIIEALNRTSRNGGGGPRAVDRLFAAGRLLGDELLPKSVKDALSETEVDYLILRLDDRLVQIPWELIVVADTFLCLRFNMGRLVKTRQPVSKSGDRSLSRPLKVWILANPKGDLEDAGCEGLQLFQGMAKINDDDEVVSPALDTEVSVDVVRERLKGFDFVHFAGHVDYDTKLCTETGWRLSDGHFTVRDIDRMAGGTPMPALIFSNACQSARNEDWGAVSIPENSSVGMTNAFLRSGVRHYVGATWEILDEPGSRFAQEFYNLLSEGKSTGEALRKTRENLTESSGPDICWNSYVLYGDPRVRYFRDSGQPSPRVEAPPAAARQGPVTRGGIFDFSLNSQKLTELKPWLSGVTVLSILIAVVLFGVFTHRWLTVAEKRARSAADAKIRQLLVERADRQTQRIDRLFDKLAKLVEPLPETTPLAEENPAIAAVFDTGTIHGYRDQMILHAVQDQILGAGNRFRLLEAESFDIVLAELIRKIELTPPDKRTRPRLRTPEYSLILASHDDRENNRTVVLMRLVENDSRRIVETLFYELEGDKRILDQKTELAGELLKRLAGLAADSA